MFSLSLWLKLFNLLSICCTLLEKSLLDIIEYILKAIDTNFGQHIMKFSKIICTFIFLIFIMSAIFDLMNDFMNVSEKTDNIIIFIYDNSYLYERDYNLPEKVLVNYNDNNIKLYIYK